MAHCASWHTRITLALITGLIFLFLAMPPALAVAAEFTIRPSMAISEEYSDNVNQEQDKRSEFTTRVNPGLSLDYKALRWDAAVNYGFEYLYYARGNKKEGNGGFTKDDTRHTLSARGLGRIVPNLFFLEVQNDYRRVDLNLVRASRVPVGVGAAPALSPTPEFQGDALAPEDTLEPEYAETTTRESDSSDRNTFTLSPHFAFQPTARTTLRTGYRYINTWYREDEASNSHVHEIFANAGYQLTTSWALNSGYSATWDNPADHDEDRELRHNAFVGTSYVFSPATSVFGQIGNTWRDKKNGQNTSDLFWNAGIRHELGRYIATFATTVRYVDDPLEDATRKETVYAATLTRPYVRGTAALTASHSRFDDPKATKTGAGVILNHELARSLTGNAGLSFSRRKEDRIFLDQDGRVQTAQDQVKEWQTRLGLSCLLGEDFTAGLNYLYIHSSSDDSFSDDNYRENRVTLEVRKIF
ncbi:MAG TPA: hypothetical protein ENN39_12495 [Desulfonatronum sp.]|nr:hypothetical protein [Desulfonatronum sp.]